MKLILAIIAMAILTSCEEVVYKTTVTCTKAGEITLSKTELSRNSDRAYMVRSNFHRLADSQVGCTCEVKQVQE